MPQNCKPASRSKLCCFISLYSVSSPVSKFKSDVSKILCMQFLIELNIWNLSNICRWVLIEVFEKKLSRTDSSQTRYPNKLKLPIWRKDFRKQINLLGTKCAHVEPLWRLFQVLLTFKTLQWPERFHYKSINSIDSPHIQPPNLYFTKVYFPVTCGF